MATGGQAQGLPLRGRFGGLRETAWVAVRGQAQGLPLRDSFEGMGRRGDGDRRAGTRPAPTGRVRGEGPSAQLQWSVVSGRRLRLTCLSVCGGMAVV